MRRRIEAALGEAVARATFEYVKNEWHDEEVLPVGPLHPNTGAVTIIVPSTPHVGDIVRGSQGEIIGIVQCVNEQGVATVQTSGIATALHAAGHSSTHTPPSQMFGPMFMQTIPAVKKVAETPTPEPQTTRADRSDRQIDVE